MRQRMTVVVMLAVFGLTACRPSDILSVPAPTGTVANSALQNQTGAEEVFDGAKVTLFNAIDAELVEYNGLLTDEMIFSGFGYNDLANIDARRTVGSINDFQEAGDADWTALLQARSDFLVALPLLAAYEPVSNQYEVGEAYALIGYTEVLVAESYCAGTPLSQVLPGGGIEYGYPLTTDSLLAVAQSHFDSALNKADGDSTVTGLASVGLARASLDRGQLTAASTAAQGVPANFVYNAELSTNPNAPPYAVNLYAGGIAYSYNAIFNVGDREGINGLDFVSAHDPRLILDSTTYQTADGTPWRIPVKFELNLSQIPIATGIEAALIQAEATLTTDPSGWLGDLNTLRTGGCTYGTDTVCAPGTGQVNGQTTGLLPLADPGTDSGRVSLMFRERAFWLYGLGNRLGDLRRLIRQYGRDQNVVFPIGNYPNGNNPNLPVPIPTYGTDVDFTLPTQAAYGPLSNPHYQGCTTSTMTA